MIDPITLYLLEQSKESIKIEDMNLLDYKKLIPILTHFGTESKGDTYFNFKEEGVKEWMAGFRKTEHKALVAKDGDTIVGLIISKVVSKGFGKVSVLFVEKEYRGSGLGAQLFNQSISWLKSKGCKVMRVVAMGQNPRAIAFYKKMGFIEERILMRDKASKGVTLSH